MKVFKEDFTYEKGKKAVGQLCIAFMWLTSIFMGCIIPKAHRALCIYVSICCLVVLFLLVLVSIKTHLLKRDRNKATGKVKD